MPSKHQLRSWTQSIHKQRAEQASRATTAADQVPEAGDRAVVCLLRDGANGKKPREAARLPGTVPALCHRGDVWWFPTPTPLGDNSLLCLSARNWLREQAALRKGVLRAEGLFPGLSAQASLPRVTACHG